MTDVPTVNKDEMARLLRVSPPTLAKMLKDYPDLPVVSGGSKGVPYAFDPAAVLAWKQSKVEEAERAAAEKSEFLNQFEFEPPADDQAAAATPAQRVQNARALKIERELAMEAGHLVHTAGVRQALTVALAVLGKGLDTLPAQLGREFNLPDAVQRAIRRRIDDSRAVMVRDVKAAVAGAPSEDPAEQLFAAQ